MLITMLIERPWAPEPGEISPTLFSGGTTRPDSQKQPGSGYVPLQSRLTEY